MEERKLGPVELRFAELIWENAPISSGELVKLCARELEWKKSTTYTVLKKLCEQGVLGENDTVVSVVTGNGLKDVANAIKFCGEPMSLPNDLTLLVEEFDKRGIKTDV